MLLPIPVINIALLLLWYFFNIPIFCIKSELSDGFTFVNDPELLAEAYIVCPASYEALVESNTVSLIFSNKPYVIALWLPALNPITGIVDGLLEFAKPTENLFTFVNEPDIYKAAPIEKLLSVLTVCVSVPSISLSTIKS